MIVTRSKLFTCAGAACVVLAGVSAQSRESFALELKQPAPQRLSTGSQEKGSARLSADSAPSILLLALNQEERKKSSPAQKNTEKPGGENAVVSQAQPPGGTTSSQSDQAIAPQEIAPIFEQRGVLTPRNTLILEPSFQYINSSSNRVALSGYTVIPSVTIGTIDVRNVNSNTYVAALSARYGLTNRLEFETRVPYVYRSDTTTTQPADTNAPATPGSVFNAEGSDIGDVEFGPRYQINQASESGTIFTIGLRVKAPTGTDPFEVQTNTAVQTPGGSSVYSQLPTGSGFWALQPSVTAILPSDPAVFFGTVSYMWNIERDIQGQGVFDPGDTLGFNVGMGMALNEKVSLSLGYDHVVLGKTTKDGHQMPGSMVTQVGSLLLGWSYKLTDTTNVSLSLGAGLTAAAANVQLTLRIPVTYLLGK